MTPPSRPAENTAANAGKDADSLATQIEHASRRLELGDPDRDAPLVDRLVNRLIEIAGVTVLVGIVAVIFVNAVSRYTLDYSFIWAEELVQMAMPWLAMTGVFLAVRRGTVIRIEFFFDRMPSWLQRQVANFGYLLSAGVLLFMGWVCFDFVRLFGGDVALYVEVPTGWSTSALVFGAVGAALAYLVEFCRHARRGTDNAAAPDQRR